ncbi:Mini-ribonuclease 3 [Alkalibacterium olivapovliticus]|uniref:Mini-ribonuclease 3 n=1 Tax=Alkalibacterium olivapovliticus TaxID=99907 RepID=A0A2T0W6M0_9LACT|nr:Mini-ribonuclease 3 [Alkalibacterium olivapovliticus]PRY82360.1 ribonuclease-3 family protein [Alkalibacterium olivapovliticus]
MPNEVNPRLINGLALAYVGDAIYELRIREYLIGQGQTKPNILHTRATTYVSAKAQAYLIDQLLEAEKLTEEELDFFKRGRNAKSYSKAKNTDAKTYSFSTGFEAIMGYLHLAKQSERLNELTDWCIRTIESRK